MIAASVYIMYQVVDLIVIYYILTHTLYAAYFKKIGVVKWWLALLPCGVTYTMHFELMTLPKYVTIFHPILVALTFLSPLPFWIAYRLIIYARDYRCSSAMFDDSAAKWALIPLYRYVYMLKTLFKRGDEVCGQ